MKRLALRYTRQQLDIFFAEQEARYNIFPKGRRFGATHGAANACIEWALEGMPILWGDTINANISRYVERYFLPTLKRHQIEHHWSDLRKVLTIGTGYIDFRSADRPENWEGFAYRRIILNEAGIILADPYLYTNAVLPMMLDFTDAQLFALGVPKGKKLPTGKEHPFYTLWKRVEAGVEDYRGQTYTSYDNPLNEASDIEAMEREMLDPEQVRQEVYGEFIDRVGGTPFAIAFADRHVQATTRRKEDLHYFSLDFNVEPFAGVASHVWTDADGPHFHTFAEADLGISSIRGMAEWIRVICPYLHLIRITGDRGGYSRQIGADGPVRLFAELRKELRISEAQFQVPANPRHIRSREDVNYTLANHPDHRIDPSCQRLIADLRYVEVDATGSIVKANRQRMAERADYLDAYRYTINTYLRPWIDQSRRRHEPV